MNRISCAEYDSYVKAGNEERGYWWHSILGHRLIGSGAPQTVSDRRCKCGRIQLGWTYTKRYSRTQTRIWTSSSEFEDGGKGHPEFRFTVQ